MSMDLDIIHREHVELKRLFDRYRPMLEEMYPQWLEHNRARRNRPAYLDEPKGSDKPSEKDESKREVV